MVTRASLEKALRGPITDREEQWLDDQHYFADDEATDEEAVRALKRLRRVYDRGTGPRPEPRSRMGRPFIERLTAIDLLHTTHAWPEVERLRERLSRLLTPIEDQVAIVRAHQRGDGDVPWPALLPLPAGTDVAEWIEDQYQAAGGVEVIERALLARSETRVLSYPAGRTVRRLTVAGGVLAVLGGGAARLAERWLWEEHAAVRWVLVGDPPPQVSYARSIVRVRQPGALDTATRIVLEVDPELTPDEVAEIYARTRARARPAQRVRPLSMKALRLARVRLEHPDAEWHELRSRWNRSQGKQHGIYPDTGVGRANFARDVGKAVRRLSHRGWRPG